MTSFTGNFRREQVYHYSHRLFFQIASAPLTDKSATGVADFIFSIFCRHGWPKRIISDQGREFVNRISR